MNRNKRTYYPIYFALVLFFGLFIGSKLGGHTENGSSLFSSSNGKLNKLVRTIEKDYVDDVNVDSIVEMSMAEIMDKLDPHSNYISADKMVSVKENMKGNFDGIGIEFQMHEDTLIVLRAIDGGPSAQAGLEAGDRITYVDSFNIAGKDLLTSEITSKIKGASGSKVNVSVKRKTDSLSFEITRGTIPLKSVEVAYQMDENTYYVKINRFAGSTIEEVGHVMRKIKESRTPNIIVDLRSNPGGYLHAAVDLSEYFLSKGDLIVYTQGRNRPEEKYFSDRNGFFRNAKLCVLINENSASASEIVAGAIQDNDRGTIIGRRSFGKGLVQEQFIYKDGSASRMTTARYYTPSGRSIQRDYSKGKKDYYQDFYKRLESGELLNEDSIPKIDSLVFKTKAGRTVYGGGGIYPDFFIPQDSNQFSHYFELIYAHNIVNEAVFNYWDRHLDELKVTNIEKYQENFEIPSKLIKWIENKAKKMRVVPKDFSFNEKDIKFLKKNIKLNLANKLWSSKGFQRIRNTDDPMILKAQEVFEKK
ncbi:MAG: S41 family peptidase [Flavobacteriales bacterium]|jgi:carboxyl-terminal processing protease|nr:S41 family peptidase [Flavobacteriales bacterium]